MYLLMNKDKEVARFFISDGDFGNTYSFQRYSGEKLPIGFDYIEAWIDNRKAYKHNAHLRQVMKDWAVIRQRDLLKIRMQLQ